jgi:tRNA pseudouridine55 synthase
MAKRRGQPIDGLVLLDKPIDVSSNRALQTVKRLIDANKAGHTGTLDPFATGLLICCLGRATKLASRMLDADKEYLATVQFGQETDSGDLTGQIIKDLGEDLVMPHVERIETVLQQFTGTITQIPPMTSALKHQGKPLYFYARQGIEIERPPREVHIHGIVLESLSERQAVIRVRCSKGTYIRTLAQDIGRELGVFAHLVALQRTCIGPFDLKQAWTLPQIETLDTKLAAVIPLTSIPDLSESSRSSALAV